MAPDTSQTTPTRLGNPFAGTSAEWWASVRRRPPRQRLDDLLVLALFDSTVCERLLVTHDPALLDAFAFDAPICHWLGSLCVSSLTELAQIIQAEPRGMPTSLLAD